MLLKNSEQDEHLTEILNRLYDNQLEITQNLIEKVLNVIFNDKDNDTYLPYNLFVEKVGNKVEFSFRQNKNLGLLLLFILGFLFLGGFATYSGVRFLAQANLNIDLNNDGIADLNIDTNGDGICDINCDTNKDRKPDLNIDYRGNRKAMFNVKREDGSIFNPMNQDLDKDGKCDLNCDTDDDGWPDTNIDLDGDGKPDINIDTDGDGVPDINVDTNGDGVPDLNIDEDDDGICDKNCTFVSGKDGQTNIGDNDVTLETAALVVTFADGNNVTVENLYPDDQKGNVNTKVPDINFSIENRTDRILYYNINWLNITNTFTSTNFWFKVWSDYNGFKQDFQPTPFTDGLMASHVAIAPKTTQNYTVSFTLHGTGAEQNYDQGKHFGGRITVELLNE